MCKHAKDALKQPYWGGGRGTYQLKSCDTSCVRMQKLHRSSHARAGGGEHISYMQRACEKC
eukprot:1142406-Pelagomonas_calceolata.AAC.1